jgi:hypothetical protein
MSRTLEIKFCDELNQTRSCCTDDVATILGVVHLAVNGRGTIELTVVESIECFRPKLQRSRFGHVHIFFESDITLASKRPTPGCQRTRMYSDRQSPAPGESISHSGVALQIAVAIPSRLDRHGDYGLSKRTG